MDDLYHRLEAQVKMLIQECEQLKQANHKLKQGKTLLLREKELLLAKHKNAITQIETMLSHFKALEVSQ